VQTDWIDLQPLLWRIFDSAVKSGPSIEDCCYSVAAVATVAFVVEVEVDVE